MRIPPDPIFDVALLLADVREIRSYLLPKFRGSRFIAEQAGIPVSTVQLHLRPSYKPGAMTVEHAVRWMLWLGKHDIREYEKDISNQEDLL